MLSAGLGLLVSELDEPERARHAIRDVIWDIDRRLHAHGGSESLLVERGSLPGQPHTAREPAHEQLREDLKRLARLDGLRLLTEELESGEKKAGRTTV